MLIDWFTVGAQIVNFLILVWLLKRYLYGPMLTAIDAREKDIASRRAAAVAAQDQAGKAREECKRQKEGLEQERLAVLKTAQDAAKIERDRLLATASSDAENLRAARSKELEEATATYQTELIRLTRQEIIATVRKAIGDLASADMENSAFDLFLRKLRESPARENAARADHPVVPALLQSAFALSPMQQVTATKEIQGKFRTGEAVAFQVAPDLGLGFDLLIHDQKFSWNINSYLDSFAAHLTDLSKANAQKVAA